MATRRLNALERLRQAAEQYLAVKIKSTDFRTALEVFANEADAEDLIELAQSHLNERNPAK